MVSKIVIRNKKKIGAILVLLVEEKRCELLRLFIYDTKDPESLYSVMGNAIEFVEKYKKENNDGHK